MVGAQKATKIASNFFPLRNRYSETMMMETTTSNNKQFIAPTFSIKFLIMLRKVIPVKYS